MGRVNPCAIGVQIQIIVPKQTYIFSPDTFSVPPNDPINARALSLVPGYHSFPKWAIEWSRSLVLIQRFQWARNTCRLDNSKYFSSQTTTCEIQFDSDVKAKKIKLNGRGWFPQVTWFYTFYLFFIGHNLLSVCYQFEYKGTFCKYGLYYTWVQMLLQIGPLLRLGPNRLRQMGPLLHLGPVITLVPSTGL